MHNEQVFTPSWMVNLMLDKLQYFGNGVLQKHIIDNSCGRGAFLTEIVERYCDAYFSVHRSKKGLKEELETYIHGIEVDEICWGITIVNLNRIGLEYGIENINWDIIHGDALEIDSFNGRMDYVVGNPPYCNVHDFGEKYDAVKKFSFAQGGMTDLYLVFFELGINMLNSTGKLIYITPSSWTASVAGRPFRQYLIENDILSEIVTLGHERVFKNATTFTMITLIDKVKDDIMEEYNNVTLYKYNPNSSDIDYIATRPLSTFIVGDTFCFDDNSDVLKLLKEIEKHEYTDDIKVKNGFATLNDKLFIIGESLPECGLWANSRNFILTIKASTGEMKWAIFPYDMLDNMKPLDFTELNPYAAQYLSLRAKQLHMDEDGKMKGQWWLYGRTQAIKDVSENKCAINNLIRNKDDIKISFVPSGIGVYSGFYIIPDKKHYYVDFEEYLRTDEFENYVKALGRYKNGGYYAFTTKELQNYLNYKLNGFRK